MKRARDPLFELEWSHQRTMLPSDARARYLWVGLPILLIIASVYLLDETATVRSVFAIGAGLSGLAGLVLSLKPILTIWENPNKDWWLAFPVPRKELMRAKMNAVFRLQAYVSLAMWATCALSSLVRLAMGELDSAEVTPGGFLLDAVAYLILSVPVNVLFVSAGFSFMGMYYGSRRWLNIPFITLIVAIISFFPAVGDHTLQIDRWLRGDVVLAYALGGLLLSPIAYRLVLRFTARYGLNDLSKHRAGSSFIGMEQERRTEEPEKARFRFTKPGFSAVYALERSRYAHFLSLTIVRMIVAFVAALVAVGGYFASADYGNLFGLFKVLLLPTCLVPATILVTLNQYEANRKRLSWWLCFPYDRRTLLLARYLAVLSLALRTTTFLIAAYAVGFAANALVNGLPLFLEAADAIVALYFVLFYLVNGLAISSIMLAQPYSFRAKIFAWIYGPLAGLLYLVPTLIGNRLLPDTSSKPEVESVQWLVLALIVVLAVPLAFVCFRTGARWIHLYLQNTQEANGRRRYLEADRK